MVKDSIQQIIYSSLHNYIKEDNIQYIVEGHRIEYIIKIHEFLIVLSFDYIDEFYTVKLENWHNNFLNNITKLSQSKDFNKSVRKIIKQHKMNYYIFQSHVMAIFFLIRKKLDEQKSLSEFEQLFHSNLKFDGIFLKQ